MHNAIVARIIGRSGRNPLGGFFNRTAQKSRSHIPKDTPASLCTLAVRPRVRFNTRQPSGPGRRLFQSTTARSEALIVHLRAEIAVTTKVKLECPDNSHWHVKVEVRDRVFDHAKSVYTDDWSLADSFVLKQTEGREVYIHDSRKLIVTEILPA